MIKKGLQFLLTIVLVFTSLIAFPNPIISITTVNAAIDYNLYPMACAAYEVDYVTDQGGFANQGCYDDIGSAIAKMQSLGDDGVVRHPASYSPTKVIAMGAGVVYSYPQRSGANTTTLNQYASSISNMKQTYVTVHREMAYLGLNNYNGDGTGQVHVNLTGFDGYINLKNVDLVPMKFITNQYTIYLGGNDAMPTNEQPFNTHIYQGYYQVVQNGNYRDLVYNYFSGWSSNTWPSHWTSVVGAAADWMTTGSTYYSFNGYDFYGDRNYRSYLGTYYNYYQFLPLRSISNIPAATYNKFLESKNYTYNSKLYNQGQAFINAQNAYGMNAALVFAMACLESGYGTSNYAVNRNNLFGWAAYDSDPNQAAYFSSIEAGINEHMAYNLRKYIDINDTRFFGSHLGNKGSGLNVKYAADPYWGYKIASIAYELDKCNHNYDGTYTDYNTLSLGLINTYGVNIKQSASAGSPTLYNSAYGATYQSNFTVVVRSEGSGWSQIQTTNPISNGSIVSGSAPGLAPYDFNTSVGYLPTSQITKINATLTSSVGTTPTGDYVASVSGLSWNEDKLSISGSSYQPGIYVNASNTITQQLNIYNALMNKTSYPLTSSVTDNDKVSYTNTDIDVSELAIGSYLFEITSTYSTYSDYNHSFYIPSLTLPETKDINGKTYTFSLEGTGDAALLKLTISESIPDCGENGTYDEVTKACICSNDYTGSLCEVKPLDCGDNGIYNKNTQACVCVNNFSGDLCEVEPDCGTNGTYDANTKACVCSNNYSGELCELEPSQKQAIKEGTTKFEFDGTNLEIEGFAFISLMNAKSDSSVTHKVILTNLETQATIEFDANSSVSDTPINFYDGYTYANIDYQATIDLTSIPAGNYTMKIQVTNGSKTMSSYIINTQDDLIPGDITNNGNLIRVAPRQTYGYRYEIVVQKTDVDNSVIIKPTLRDSLFGMDSISLEDAKLNIEGLAWIYNINFNTANTPSEKVIFVDTTSGKSYTYSLTNKACEIDYTTSLKSKYDLTNGCFTSDVDLTQLPKGTYDMYIDVKTKNAHDIYEMNNDYGLNIEDVTLNGTTYSINTTKMHSRMQLTVK